MKDIKSVSCIDFFIPMKYLLDVKHSFKDGRRRIKLWVLKSFYEKMFNSYSYRILPFEIMNKLLFVALKMKENNIETISTL